MAKTSWLWFLRRLCGHSTDPGYYLRVGDTAFLRGNLPMALRCFEIAIELDPEVVPMIREALDGETIFAIRDFLGPEECEQLISLSESIGYQAAGLGDEVVLQLRNNGRAVLEDHDLAARLWHRARPFLSERKEEGEACGLHERFRFYRYEAAEMFAPHYDGCVSRGEDEVSQLTFMIYLNGECEGGATRFYQRNGILRFEVTPERGKALIFEHAQMHEGAPVVQGRKYVLRTDVMYRRTRGTGGVGEARA